MSKHQTKVITTYANLKKPKLIVDIFEQRDSLKYIVSQEQINGDRALFLRKNLVDKDGNGFEVDIYKEKDLMSVKGLFNIYG